MHILIVVLLYTETNAIYLAIDSHPYIENTVAASIETFANDVFLSFISFYKRQSLEI